MNDNPFEDVLEFHTVGGQQRRPLPELPILGSQKERNFYRQAEKVLSSLSDRCKNDFGDSEQALRMRLILEETAELLEALSEGNIEKTADALVDLNYVVLGAGVTWGINLAELHNEVHAANMRKFPGGKAIRDENGKVLKPEGWTGPDVEAVLENQTALFLEE